MSRGERERERGTERERGEKQSGVPFVILLNFVTDHSFSIFEHSSSDSREIISFQKSKIKKNKGVDASLLNCTHRTPIYSYIHMHAAL